MEKLMLQLENKNRPLGRGLDSLLGNVSGVGDSDPLYSASKDSNEIKEVEISFLKRGKFQPRQHFDKNILAELAESIRDCGIMQPIIVRPLEGAEVPYEIIAGERRWLAAQMIGLKRVPVSVQKIPDKKAMEIALTENIQRLDLNPIEEARGYKQLMESFNHTQEELAQIVHKSRSHIANILRLLTLPISVQEHLLENRLTVGHARALINVPNAEALADKIVAGNLNVRSIESLKKKKKLNNLDLKASTDATLIAEQLAQILKLPITINFTGSGGEVKIKFKSLEQLDQLVGRLNVT